ncbi:DNA-binding transcriptional regulator, LysR family [Lachnospiraceae bacterium XBD2001]|nr:DNA-binding transcriptional regulator, LysR family [Lachnospiraceae bacterium XBD2001]
MTLKQLSYVVTVAETGSITEAAKQLYIAQPSLTTAVKELEQEYCITIFHRSKKGIELTPEGDEFLGYARQLLDQANLMNAHYTGTKQGKQRFCVSAQHYSFAVEAFVKLIQASGGDKYEFHMRETQTYDIIDDVAHRRSEIGVLYLNTFNEPVIRKTLRDHGLTFTALFRAAPHVFIGKNSPLAKKKEISLEDLAPYPRLSYEQGSHNSFYFSEEILSTMDSDKEIIVRDRATLFNLLVGLNGYTICSGVISEELNGPHIIAKPLAVDDYMEIGYILPANTPQSALTEKYICFLNEALA